MPARGTKQLHFPAGGIDRSSAFQYQPPFTTPYAVNVHSTDPTTRQERGGSRKGLTRLHELTTLPEQPNMLVEFDVVEESQRALFRDDFQREAFGSLWTVAGTTPTLGLRTEFSDRPLLFEQAQSASIVRTKPTDMSSPLTYWMHLRVIPTPMASGTAEHFFGTFTINDYLPLATPGDGTIIATLTLTTNGAYSGNITASDLNQGGAVNNSTVFPNASIGSSKPGWFSVQVNRTANTATAYFEGVNLGTVSLVGLIMTQTGVGFTCTPSLGQCRVGEYVLEYQTATATEQRRRRFLVASQGNLWESNDVLNLTAVTSPSNLTTDDNLTGAARLQRVYLADHGDLLDSGSANGVTGTALDRFDCAAVADWTTLGINLARHVLTLTNSTGTIVEGTYLIIGVAAGELTLARNIATSLAVGACNWRVERGPKVYDPADNTLSLWMASGAGSNIPVSNPIVVTWRDRLVFAGGAVAPQAWYMSRQGDPNDWNYGAEVTDAQRAIASDVSTAGRIGEPITAVIPFADDSLVFGTTNEVWIMRGDPALGGQLINVSRETGILGRQTWCWAGENDLYFLGKGGLWVIKPDGGPPSPVSRNKVPNKLLDLNPAQSVITMGFDRRERLVHVFIATDDNVSDRHYAYSTRTGAFWAMTYDRNHEPTAVLYFQPDTNEPGRFILGCRDGRLRTFDWSAVRDDGVAFTSVVVYGPFRLGSDDGWGIIEHLQAALARDSMGADVSVVVGETLEEVMDNIATESAWRTQAHVTGVGARFYCRALGFAAAVVVRSPSGGSSRWMLEQCTATIRSAGRQKRS